MQVKVKGKGMVLYSAISSPLDRSKRFTLQVGLHAHAHARTHTHARTRTHAHNTQAKREKRRRERAWRKSKLEVHRQCFREQCKLVNAMLLDAKTNFYTNKIQEIGNDQKKLFAAANTLLHFKNETKLPVHVSSFELAERFSTFFEEKIVDIRRELSVTATQGVSSLEHCQRCSCEFLHFSLPSDEAVKSVMVKAASKHCDLDPAPSWLLKLSINALLPVVSRVLWNLQRFPMNSKSHKCHHF